MGSYRGLTRRKDKERICLCLRREEKGSCESVHYSTAVFKSFFRIRTTLVKMSSRYETVNPLMLRAAKRGLMIVNMFLNTYKSIFLKTFEREMIIRSHTTTLPQIIFELSLYSKVTFKNMREADDTF